VPHRSACERSTATLSFARLRPSAEGIATGRRYQERLEAYLGWSIAATGLLKAHARAKCSLSANLTMLHTQRSTADVGVAGHDPWRTSSPVRWHPLGRLCLYRRAGQLTQDKPVRIAPTNPPGRAPCALIEAPAAAARVVSGKIEVWF
jgi:hypothetical protein